MKLRLQVLIESDAGEIVTTEDVAAFERHSLQLEEAGLTLAEARQMLGSVQCAIVQEQVAEYIAKQSHCSDCGPKTCTQGPT